MNEAFLAGDTGANQYKAVCGKGTINSIVNIQQFGAATEPGIYVSFKDANLGTMTVNGVKLDAFVDGAGVIMYLSNFKYMYSDVVFTNGDGTQKAVIYVYNAQGIDNSDKAIEGTTTTQAPTTQAPTTQAPTTQAPTAGVQNTTAAPTTAKQDTTVAPTTKATVKVTAPAKAKINKVNSKKKAAKKVKLSLKKTKGAAGYQVAIYKTKKNAKNNKKALVKKFVNKVKVTITSKKLKNKKSLYVRARAYVLDANGKKLYGKWSNVKKVKIK